MDKEYSTIDQHTAEEMSKLATCAYGEATASVSSSNKNDSKAIDAPPIFPPLNQPGYPDPDAEVVSLSPRTLMSANNFTCEICNKGFQREQNLQLHMRGHNQLQLKMRQTTTKDARRKVYVCPETSCMYHDPTMALGDLKEIKKHFKRKHGERKWKCEKCSKRYAIQSDWRAHCKTCGLKEYKCACGTTFTRRDSFITHRAFCDALVQETKRSLTTQHTFVNYPVQSNADHLSAVQLLQSNFSNRLSLINPIKRQQLNFVDHQIPPILRPSLLFQDSFIRPQQTVDDQKVTPNYGWLPADHVFIQTHVSGGSRSLNMSSRDELFSSLPCYGNNVSLAPGGSTNQTDQGSTSNNSSSSTSLFHDTMMMVNNTPPSFDGVTLVNHGPKKHGVMNLQGNNEGKLVKLREKREIKKKIRGIKIAFFERRQNEIRVQKQTF